VIFKPRLREVNAIPKRTVYRRFRGTMPAAQSGPVATLRVVWQYG
jgi:hypothetical protein